MSTRGSSGGGGAISTASSGRVTTGIREPEWRGTRSTSAIFTDASGATVRRSGDAAAEQPARAGIVQVVVGELEDGRALGHDGLHATRRSPEPSGPSRRG